APLRMAAASAVPAPTTLSRGDAQSASASQAPLTLTFDQAMARALAANESLKVSEARVAESRARVSEARTGYLPEVNVSYLYTPSQKFPVIRIPGGVFGPDETTFQAGFTRENIMSL